MTPSDTTAATETTQAATSADSRGLGGPSGAGRAGEEAIEVARIAAAAADDKSATDVAILDVTAILSICEAFVICSARNPRQVAAVSEEIEEKVATDLGRRPLSVEGLDDRRWVLLDYGDTVIHVFLDDERDVYRLDRLYSDAPRIEWRDPSSD